ncbi:hypothetical protein MXEN_01739 [Mycobacterium xenopi RIVM700367]|uniref:hypothetical protein n=1 Tax=Mycobacterium xenopi TaxID=1789 RepID=UPI00025ACBE7|nr:hypothetical protein [Mycobacterium xenopi]EID17144.1 hypothetical protein MXEN_01739 [Mycobacterium xenopi RIVM700367]
MSSDESELWSAALEEYAANMSAQEFRAFTARVRPPDDDPLAPTDPAARATRQHWQAKVRQLLSVPSDHNGARGTGIKPVDLTQHLPEQPETPQPAGFSPNRAQSHTGTPPTETNLQRIQRIRQEGHY